MRLTQIAKSVALAGMLATVAMPGFAQESPKEATAATKAANDAFTSSSLSPTRQISPMLTKDSSPPCRMR